MKNYVYAGFWDRFIMGLLDLIIVLGLIYVIKTPLHVNFFSIYSKELSQFYTVWFIRAIPFLYYIGSWKLLGGTPANIVRQVRILDCATGEKPSLVKLLIRFPGMFVSAPLLFLGYFQMLWDSRKQTWHDKLAGSVVVRNKTHKKAEISIDDIDSIAAETGLQFPIEPSERDVSLWKFGRFVTAISAVLFVMFCIYWFRDEPLSPGAKQWLSEIDYEIDDPYNNVYYHLDGFQAPEGMLPYIYSRENAEINNRNVLKYQQNLGVSKADEIPFEEELNNEYFPVNDFKKLALNLKDPDSLFLYCTQRKSDILALKQKYSFLDERYKKIEELATSGTFRNPFIPSPITKLPIFMHYVSYLRMQNHFNSLDYIEGSRKDAVKNLLRNLSTNITLTEQAPDLISKLALSIAVRDHIITLCHLLDYNSSDSCIHTEIDKMNYLSSDFTDMTKVFKSQFYEQIATLLTTYTSVRKLYSRIPFEITEEDINYGYLLSHRPGETINQEYKMLASLAEFSKLPGDEFVHKINRDFIPQRKTIDALRNLPLYIITIAVPDWNEYTVKLHDINGTITLTKLKSLIYQNNIKKSSLDVFLEENKEKLHNPFSDEAIQFNAETNEIYYTGPYQEDHKDYRSVKLTF